MGAAEQLPAPMAPEQYRRSLPASELAALDLWLGSFYPFQRDWLLDNARNAICCKGRQYGFSHTTSAVAVLWGAFHGELTTVISIGQDEANEVLDKARRHIYVLRGLGSQMARASRVSKSEIVFSSGGRIKALPSSGGRGFTGNVFFDEYAYHQFAKDAWENAAPAARLGFRRRVVSTPNGTGNEFYNLWKAAKRPNSGWSVHEVPYTRAVADGFPFDMADAMVEAKGDPRIFAQLYGCSFLDSELQYIPSALIDAARSESTWCEEGECYAGLDVGRTNDLTALVIIKRDAHGVCWQQRIETRKRTAYEDLEALAAMAFGAPYFCRRLCVDATGMGAFPAEQLQKKFGLHAVEPVVFTNQSKEDLATTLYQAFADKRIRLEGGDSPSSFALREDIAAIRRVVTAAGNVRYDAPHTDEGHADRAWALALAVHGCSRRGQGKHVLHDYDDTELD